MAAHRGGPGCDDRDVRVVRPLLVPTQRRGPLGVGELADWVGRDYTTVSRQVAKLESLGLIARRAGKTDRGVTEAVVTEKGWAMSEMLDAARERLAGKALAGWSEMIWRTWRGCCAALPTI